MPVDPVEAEQIAKSPKRDVTQDFRRLMVTLASRARWLGSRDPEAAAQEALRRSLEKVSSQAAIVYYFSEDIPADSTVPEWPLDQLLAWLHGVLFYVVQEEHHRAASRREVSLEQAVQGLPDETSFREPVDAAPDPLDLLIRSELSRVVVDCFPKLDRDYRMVLSLRIKGLKYGEIAVQLGVSENTVATWVSRAIKTLAQCVHRRTGNLVDRSHSSKGVGPHD